MAVFITLTTDAFRDQFAKTTAGKRNARREKNAYSRAGARSVRRPLRGLEIKEDTYAIIRLLQADGAEVPLLDSSSASGQSAAYSNFILQTVQESRMEKQQIVETFGDSYLFLFGEAPRFLEVNAILVNSHDFNWEAEWWYNYEHYLRGTKSVELGARTYLFYDDNVVEGYMLQAQSAKMADQPLMVQLTFRLFVTDYDNISFIGDPAFPIRSTANLPDGVDLTQTLSPGQLSSVLESSSQTADTVFDRTYPIRGNIADNWDEWTGDAPPVDYGQDEPLTDVEDLHQAVLTTLSDYGVMEVGPNLLSSLGLQARFSAGVGVGFGAGASSGVTATFGASASANVSASAFASAAVGAGASFGGGVGVGAAVAVGGSPTAFAVASARGTLHANGNANASASAAVGFDP